MTAGRGSGWGGFGMNALDPLYTIIPSPAKTV